MADMNRALSEWRGEILHLVRQRPEEHSPFEAGKTPVPVSGKVIGARELELMTEAVLDAWLTTGRFNDRFEKALGEYLNVRHVLTVNSGSSANLLALAALTSPELGERAIRPGDEVITPAANFPTTIAPILQIGAVPVFVDIELSTWNADIALLEQALSPRTKAVVLAHSLGNPFDAAAVKRFCEQHGLWFVEDACDALGATLGGRHVGTFGDFGTLSCYPAHHVTMGEGGALYTNDAALARLARSFRDWGRHCHCRTGQDNACGHRFDGQYGELPQGYDHKYVYSHVGYNLKITDIQAACGAAQMERLPAFVKTRRKNWRFLRDRLEACPWLEFESELPEAEASWFGFPILLKENAPGTRLELLRHLDAHKIGTRLLFAGNAVRQPFLQGQRFRVASELSNTGIVMNRGFWIGVFPGLTEEMLDYAAQTLLDYFKGKA